MADHFILTDSGKTKPASFEEWVAWAVANKDQRSLAAEHVGDFWVSTVFLGNNHTRSHRDRRTPIVFETMVFHAPGGEINYSGLCQRRYPTKALALKGHANAVAMVKRSIEAGETPSF